MSDVGTRALEAKNLGDYELAEQLYLLAQSEGDLLAMTNLGIMYWEIGEILSARDQFRNAAHLGYGAALWDLGNMYSQLGYVSAAFPSWEMSLPDQPQAYQTLLAMNAQRGQIEKALLWAERGIAAGIDLNPAREHLSSLIPQFLAEAGNEAHLLTEMLEKAEQLAALPIEIPTQEELCELRWQIAERRPLGPGTIDSMFGSISVVTRIGVLRPACDVIVGKSNCWALAADAQAVLMGLLVQEEADTDAIGTAASRTSRALQESLTLDPRLPSERERIIIENITNVFTVLNDPLAQLYNSYLESLD